MIAETRPDFLNLKLFTRAINSVFGTIPHSLVDNFGNVISILAPENTAPGTLDIQVRGKSIARLSGPDPARELMKGTVEAVLEAELRANEATSIVESGQLLASDLDALLDLSEAEDRPLEELLRQTMRLLRAHVWVERASIFGMLDGFTLEGLSGIGWPDDSWKSAYASAAGTAASSRQTYMVADPTKDPQLKELTSVESIRNLFCIPLLHGTSLVGVMLLSNKVGGPFLESDLQLVKRFSNLAPEISPLAYIPAIASNIAAGRADQNIPTLV